jgi:hypothetical protein
MMKSGTYYVGDLCYVLHERWDEVCELIIDEHRCLDGEFNLKDGTRFAIYGTAYGDGTYKDKSGKEYGVDAGSIGCVLLSNIDLNNKENFLDGGNIHTFEVDFYTGTQDGKIMFHTLSIDTDPVYDEEEEYESF